MEKRNPTRRKGDKETVRRPPEISQGQINRGLCGFRGCPNLAGKHKFSVNGMKVPICDEHYRKNAANKKAADENKKKKGAKKR